MSVNGNQKGKRGERELAALLREHGYEEARRGQQFSGGGDSPDVIGVPGLHIECKRTETYSHNLFIDQAVHDAAGKPWAVLHKYNRRPWTATVDASFFLKLCKFIPFLTE